MVLLDWMSDTSFLPLIDVNPSVLRGNLGFTSYVCALFLSSEIIYSGGSGLNESFVCHFFDLMGGLCKRGNLVAGCGGVIPMVFR